MLRVNGLGYQKPQILLLLLSLLDIRMIQIAHPLITAERCRNVTDQLPVLLWAPWREEGRRGVQFCMHRDCVCMPHVQHLGRDAPGAALGGKVRHPHQADPPGHELAPGPKASRE